MFDDVIEEVRSRTEGGSAISKKKFAKECGFSTKTLQRFLNGETVSVNNLLMIFQVIYKDDHLTMIKTLSDRFPDNQEIKAVMKFIETQNINTSFDSDLLKYWTKPGMPYTIMGLLCDSAGYSKVAIEERFGEEGLQFLSELSNAKKLEEIQGDRVRLKNYTFAASDGTLLKALALVTLGEYKPETYATPESQITWSLARVSEVGAEKVKAILMQTAIDLLKVEKEHPGSIPISYLTSMIKLASDSADKQNLN